MTNLNKYTKTDESINATDEDVGETDAINTYSENQEAAAVLPVTATEAGSTTASVDRRMEAMIGNLPSWAQIEGGGRSVSDLPQHIQNRLSTPPKRGDGLNLWFFGSAILLHPHLKPGEIVSVLQAVTKGQPVKPGEIERAVERSAAASVQEVQPADSTLRSWPRTNQPLRDAITGMGVELADLVKVSPKNCAGLDAENAIDHLFPGNPLLCCGWTLKECVTAKREEWRGQMAQEIQFIVPSPMSAETGLTQEGKESMRCLNNTGPRRFLVIDQDVGTKDEQAAVLVHLATMAPLAMVIDSGGRSIHGWFYCEGRSDDEIRPFMAYAVSLGADPATWTPCQFVRIPGGTRDNGSVQQILFFNPSVLEDTK